MEEKKITAEYLLEQAKKARTSEGGVFDRKMVVLPGDLVFEMADRLERLQGEHDDLKEELEIEKHNHKATQWHFDNSYNEGVRLLEVNKELQKQVDEYKSKIEQGTLIELPCKVRTMVYYMASYKKKIGFWGKWKYCNTIMEIPFELEMLDTYGNNWFLTREEAEKRLKELQE